MKIVAMNISPLNHIHVLKYRVEMIIHSRSVSEDVFLSKTSKLKYLTQVPPKQMNNQQRQTLPSHSYPQVMTEVLFYPLQSRQCE